MVTWIQVFFPKFLLYLLPAGLIFLWYCECNSVLRVASNSYIIIYGLYVTFFFFPCLCQITVVIFLQQFICWQHLSFLWNGTETSAGTHNRYLFLYFVIWDCFALTYKHNWIWFDHSLLPNCWTKPPPFRCGNNLNCLSLNLVVSSPVVHTVCPHHLKSPSKFSVFNAYVQLISGPQYYIDL